MPGRLVSNTGADIKFPRHPGCSRAESVLHDWRADGKRKFENFLLPNSFECYRGGRGGLPFYTRRRGCRIYWRRLARKSKQTESEIGNRRSEICHLTAMDARLLSQRRSRVVKSQISNLRFPILLEELSI